MVLRLRDAFGVAANQKTPRSKISEALLLILVNRCHIMPDSSSVKGLRLLVVMR
jgi:hypothetical protein